MKSSQEGFIGMTIIVLVALGFIGGSYYVASKNKDNSLIQTVEETNNTIPVSNTEKNSIIASVPTPAKIKSDLNITSPIKNETWQIGTRHAVQWKLNTKTEPKGSFFLTVFLQDPSGKLINTHAGRDITANQTSTTVFIPYFDPKIVPGNYHLILNISDEIAPLPCVGCQGYSRLVGSATSTAVITLTPSDNKVAPSIWSLDSTIVKIGSTISVEGVAFQPDSKVIFERVNPLDGQARIKIYVTPHVISSKKITFGIPSMCTNLDICIPQNSPVTPGVYYVSIETEFGISSINSIQITE